LRSPVLWIGAVVLCLAAAGSAAADTDITIQSKTLEIQEKSGAISFEGGVEVLMGEITLTCDLLTVHAGSADPTAIVSGEATGNVVMKRGTETVQAQMAVFDLEAGNVELTGSPRLTREDTAIEAVRIIYSIEEGKASFVGPVRAIFKTSAE